VTLGSPPTALAAALLELELAGRVREDRDGRLRVH
jgi:predicted Rossmann fold nucleotide-binding protein DprA/Smf involved in DNA uptake